MSHILQAIFSVIALTASINCVRLSGGKQYQEEFPKMDARIAEDLVHKWQYIKSQAFGPDHCIEKLEEVRNFPSFLHIGMTDKLLIEKLLKIGETLCSFQVRFHFFPKATIVNRLYKNV